MMLPHKIRMVDTNLLVRYFTGAPADHHRKAVAVIEGTGAVSLSIVVVAETFHVLTRHYTVPRERAVDGLTELVRRANIHTLEIPRQRMVEALALCRPSGRVSIPDVLLWARAAEEGAEVLTFDRRFPKAEIQVTTL